MRERARKEAGSVYSIDSARVEEYTKATESFFSALNKLPEKAQAMLKEDAAAPTAADEWADALDANAKASLCSNTVPIIDEASLLAVLSASKRTASNA